MIGEAWVDFIFGVYFTVAIIGFPLCLFVTGLAFGWLVARNKVMRNEVEALVDRLVSTKHAKKDE